MSPLIDIRDLKVQFLVGDGAVQAVKGVSFAIPAGRTLALVGESGSGKTVISQTLMRILPQNAEITGGQVLF
ncbi:MAG: ATP-binding cassette domain-containing protein, partial [Alphaproteobacteria bacterium]